MLHGFYISLNMTKKRSSKNCRFCLNGTCTRKSHCLCQECRNDCIGMCAARLFRRREATRMRNAKLSAKLKRQQREASRRGIELRFENLKARFKKVSHVTINETVVVHEIEKNNMGRSCKGFYHGPQSLARMTESSPGPLTRSRVNALNTKCAGAEAV